MPAWPNTPPDPSDIPDGTGWGAFVLRLFAAGTRRDMSSIALEEAERVFGCRDGLLAWSPACAPDAARVWHAVPNAPGAEDLALLAHPEPAVSARGATTGGAAGRRIARRLLPAEHALGLQLVANWPAAADAKPDAERLWCDFCSIVQARVAKALELEQQHRTEVSLERAARLQAALYAIADLASGGLDMPDMLREIHAVVGTLMYAENFLIALYDPVRDTVRFIYFADSHDRLVPEAHVETPAAELGESVTLAMMRRGHAFRGPSAALREQFGLVKAAAYGPDSADWLGVPMLGEDGVRGAVVVQSYARNVS
jgi:hypothetical protein